MKPVTVLATVLVLFSLTMPCTVHAQLWDGMKLTIPFEFYVGATKFPSGMYTVTRGANSVARLTNHGGNNAGILTIDTPNKARNVDGSLVFNKYENTYFLSEIRWQHHAMAGALTKSRLEIEIARNLGTPATLVASSGKR